MTEADLEDAPLETLSMPATAAAVPNPSETEASGSPSAWQKPLARIHGFRVGVLVGMKDEGCTPLVIFPGRRESSALPARTIIDLHGDHVGREVVLMFEDGDPQQPVIMGCLAPKEGWRSSEQPGHVEVDVDGERLVVTAKNQLVLRCGKASITLTKAGKVLIQGSYVSSRSSGVNTIKGGSIQLN